MSHATTGAHRVRRALPALLIACSLAAGGLAVWVAQRGERSVAAEQARRSRQQEALEAAYEMLDSRPSAAVAALAQATQDWPDSLKLRLLYAEALRRTNQPALFEAQLHELQQRIAASKYPTVKHSVISRLKLAAAADHGTWEELTPLVDDAWQGLPTALRKHRPLEVACSGKNLEDVRFCGKEPEAVVATANDQMRTTWRDLEFIASAAMPLNQIGPLWWAGKWVGLVRQDATGTWHSFRLPAIDVAAIAQTHLPASEVPVALQAMETVVPVVVATNESQFRVEYVLPVGHHVLTVSVNIACERHTPLCFGAVTSRVRELPRAEGAGFTVPVRSQAPVAVDFPVVELVASDLGIRPGQ